LPHIVILDLLMPEVDGWEWVKRVKEKEDFEQLQIISISALSKDELEQRGGPPEGSHFIPKPIDLGWLKGYLLGLMSPQAWV
jgi:DNA-binding response OmpR family regulator